MFSLSLVDTLRLAFGQVVYHHKSHSRTASALTRCSRYFRAAETLLTLGVVITALGAAFGKGPNYAVAAAVLASLVLLLFLLHVTFDLDALARAHHVSSIRLWHVREQYRALLSDLHDGAVEPESARTRRNALIEEVTAIYDGAPPLTRHISEEMALADDEIDRFLPKSLHAETVPL
ncbi:MAG: SLATT domain-containing protein [Vicinamibacterales bacterium]|nr:SLATT domain-containing protein [Vicinamibacterales bacterium]